MSRTRTIPASPGAPATVEATPPAPRASPVSGMSQTLFSELLRQRRPGESEARPEGDDVANDTPKPAAEPDAEAEAAREKAPEGPLLGVLPTLRDPTRRTKEREKDQVRHEAPVEFVPTPQVVAPAAVRLEQSWSQMAREVGRTIAAFCNAPAVNNSEGWGVQMELRPDVIADTTLHLTLSPHWLTLRFNARDPESHELLFNAQQDISEILESSLSRKREIAISFGPT